MIAIRACQGFAELDACVALQTEIWGYSESENLPRKSFLLAQRIGGQVIGAFEEQGSGKDRNLVGFAMSLPGIKKTATGPMAYLHSHMLAVREPHRNAGLGRQLKLAQRDEALQRGICLMEWSFDPLEIKNAWLNIQRLGAVIHRYYEDFYGVSSSRLQGGLPTDRLIAEWWLDSPRVCNRLSGQHSEEPVQPEASVAVPREIAEWKLDPVHRDKALEVQRAVRMQLKQHFAAGLAIVQFCRDSNGNGTYQLGRREPSPKD